MKITMQLLWDSLSQVFPMQRFGRILDTELNWPEIYDSIPMENAGTVAVVSCDHLPEKPLMRPDCLLICAGECTNPAYRKNSFPFWIVNTSFANLANTVTDIYRKFKEWEIDLLRVVNCDANLEQLLELSLPIFGNPINLVDWNMNYCVFMSHSLSKESMIEGDNWEFQNTIAEYLPLKEDQVQQIRDRIRKNGYDNAPRFCDDYISNPLCCIDLFYNGNYIGTLGIIGVYRPFYPSDASLLKFLASCVEESFSKHKTLLEQNRNSYKDVLRDLLTGKSADISDLKHRISLPQTASKKSGADSRFLCFRAMWIGESSPPPLLYLSNLLESRIPGCLSCALEDCAAGIIHLDFIVDHKKQPLFDLDALAKDMHLHMGISNSFRNLEEIPIYYLQTGIAMKLDQDSQPGRLSRFCDHSFHHFLQHGIGTFPIESFCSTGLWKLWSERSRNDYWNILCLYLSLGCNATETARRLYMHRSSLLKRLGTISSILAVDFHDENSYEAVLELQCLIQLLKQTEPKFP